ncbi:TolC family protein [Antarcticibacterium flavum]|jgi:outer membrane protein, heavy metal efflux system|uniref:TolC family protein n=2 Tax=Flavobacteriaceae TaxID=49546 RepID=A0A5B7WY99_9FLAO|nr:MULTISPECIES: TolC family protein [Flavobacteriaceae]MCM4161683.1 TolC family protein [Antarcticibacterium sp. W02-3]NLP59200.1 TolC family protein [Lutibacter sp. B1]QCY68030.1 TolC family protein [Antarcticibacterium flavum]THV57053.1 TolC family protein [Allomuricauda alvinocaridis]CAG2533626.1 Outer membrane protein TolC [Maribacter dokdonensis]|tara:strand:- start:2271 stop:3455 length:1185 start_codon:yes stop_codon:yes gene_type:complete
MNKHIVSAICGCLFFVSGFSQDKNIEQLLNEIEQNNTELKGYQSFIESQQLENRSNNNLPDPQLSGFYLPFGDNRTGDYTEYQLSQSFEFPTVYAARGKWNESKSQQLASAYANKRQEVLLKAKNTLLELAYLQKQKTVEAERKTQSKQVFDQIQKLFDTEQVGILDLNKAKIAWIQEQFAVEQIETEIQILLSKLKTLNGGNEISGISTGLALPIEVGAEESLWQEKLSNDPLLQELKAIETSSLQKVKLEKNKVLPNVALGYNYQGVSGSHYSGFYGGVSIPLWNSKNKVKAAEANYEYQQSNTQVISTSLYTQFQETYNRYELMLKKYNEYQTTMGNLESEDLLFKAYMLGEYSFMDYYVELQFYRNASDKMLQMEKELQLLQAQLLKHQL